MHWSNRLITSGRCARNACFALALLCAAPAAAQDPGQNLVQLDPVAKEYTLGRFHYVAPQFDGWRQIANSKEALSIIYATQPEEGKISTDFGATFEAHDIPPEANVTGAAQLAELSRQQISEQRKADIVGQSPIEAVPAVDNLYTYRLLVHAPVKDAPDAYEVYYVAMAPDKSQYLVIQCITKEQEYGGSIYFTQFYASLGSLKYVPDASKASGTTPPAASPPAAQPAKPEAGKDTKPEAAKAPAKP